VRVDDLHGGGAGTAVRLPPDSADAASGDGNVVLREAAARSCKCLNSITVKQT
jgi:hypothetical protein